MTEGDVATKNDAPRTWVILFVIAVILVLVVHLFLSRPASDAWKKIGINTLLTVPTCGAFFAYELRKMRRRGEVLAPGFTAFLSVLVIAFIVCFSALDAFVSAAWAEAAEMYRRAEGVSDRLQLEIYFASSLTLILGTVLFYFRLRMRAVYGVTEALVGVAVAAQRTAIAQTSGEDGTALLVALLTAGVYLVVRGLDNVHQGLTKEPTDKVAAWAVRRMKGILFMPLHRP